MIAAVVGLGIAVALCVTGVVAFVYDLVKGNVQVHERR